MQHCAAINELGTTAQCLRKLSSKPTHVPLLCAGLGAACDIAQQEMERDHRHIKRLSERLYNGITSQLEVGGGAQVSGCKLIRWTVQAPF